jgi:2,3-bisphosphoglycerate-independent phosphoglycerate mutase
MPSSDIKPVLLIILDGFGCRLPDSHNAIACAHKPNWDRLWRAYPHTLIQASEAAVGLPAGQMGNSEVGHLNIGAGRVVYQEFTRIDRAISNTNFFINLALKDTVEKVKQRGAALHIMGLLSDGGVHSHERHIHAMLELALREGLKDVYIHAFLDGRDTPPKSAELYLANLQRKIDELGGGRVATLIGRYYAMDRDHRWQRVEAAYNLLTEGKGEFTATTPQEGLEMAYARGETDEFVKATAIVGPGQSAVSMQDGDAIVFMNFRSDRARELTRTFIDPNFSEFERKTKPQLSQYCTLTGYSDEYDVAVAFPPERISNSFGEYIAQMGLHQLRISETEKFPHVTYFFNGGEEKVYPGEDRILINSPDVATYDLKPEMSAREVTDKLVEAIQSCKYDAIICNFANPDMVGHTGIFEAAKRAVEVVDECLGRAVEAMLSINGEILITADHGNAETMLDLTNGQPHTSHTTNLVPYLYIGRHATMAENGALEDVAPTLLKMMGLPQPMEMTGRPLIEFD